jgi:hypothetical protein
MSKKKGTRVPIKDIVSEDGAHELATSPDMQPYLELLKAEIQGHDITPLTELWFHTASFPKKATAAQTAT